MVAYVAEEFSHWASHCERILGVVARDLTDNDYSWMALARDQNGCFRCANLKIGYSTGPRAEEALLEEIDRVIREEVTPDSYEEYWTQEVQVFHNPNAKYPLPFDWLLGATHHYFEDGFMKSHAPRDSVLSSFTSVLKLIEETD